MPGPKKDDQDRITAAGDMVVYCAGFPAIYGRQPLYFEDETFAARAAIPPPKHSDSLSSLGSDHGSRTARGASGIQGG